MRPFWLIPESCWQGETGAFLLRFLDFNPYDNWNIAFLPADQLTSRIMDAPLHPDAEIPAFAAAGKKFIAECASRVAQATMEAKRTADFQLVTAARTDGQNMIRALAMTFAAKLLEAHKAGPNQSEPRQIVPMRDATSSSACSVASRTSWGITTHAYRTVPLPASLRVTLDNSPSKVRAPKISKTTPCKVAGGRHGGFESKLTRRANQGHFFTIPQSCKRPSPRNNAARRLRLRLKILTHH